MEIIRQAAGGNPAALFFHERLPQPTIQDIIEAAPRRFTPGAMVNRRGRLTVEV